MRLKESVRALIVDPDDAVLLVRFLRDGIDIGAGFWANPGGGIEPGETALEAVRRELREEVGLEVDHLGPEVWVSKVLRPMTRWDGRIDHIHLYRTPRFRPRPELSEARLRAEGIQETRWWSPEELQTSGVTFFPGALPELLKQLRRDGTPATPIDVSSPLSPTQAARSLDASSATRDKT